MNEVVDRKESIALPETSKEVELAPGVHLRMLAGAECGARGLCTAFVEFLPGSTLPYHSHPCCEAIVVVAGHLQHVIEGRSYALGSLDAIHIPAELPHMARASSHCSKTTALVSFASGAPTRTLIQDEFVEIDYPNSLSHFPERLIRYSTAPKYELAPQTHFTTLFEARPGCGGICGGYGVFEPGAGLPCHTHDYDESITIVEGQAVCQAAGRTHFISVLESVSVPRGVPHRFVNRSNQQMAMIWVYAGDFPDRTIVELCCCEAGNSPPAKRR